MLTSAMGQAAAAPQGRTVGASTVKVWSLTSRERLLRSFRRLGLSQLEAAGGVVLAHVGWVYDESLIGALARRPGVVLADAAGCGVAAHVASADASAATAALEAGEVPALAGLEVLTAAQLQGTYNDELRKREPPVLARLAADNVREVEKQLFKASYKGVTDLVTKYVWPTPARIVTRWCAAAGITPNQVTFASFLLVLAALYLFWAGQFALGLAAAWGMTFLDTVDGKLARVTLSSSRWGNVFDHGIDLIHPPFWWLAWVAGLQASSLPLAQPGLILGVIVGGYVVQRLFEGVFIWAFKIHIHAWRRFDSFFRLITARRNPNLLILTAAVLAGRADIGIVLVAIWTAVSLAVHLLQLAQGFLTPRGAVVSWLTR